MRLSVICVALTLVACGPASQDAVDTAKQAATSAAVAPATPEQLSMVVYKSPACGCCSLWVEHMQRAGFKTEVRDVDNLYSIKEEAGVPATMGSCHTARIGKYFIEGHVPAVEVKRLLAEQPNAKGLTVPQMPIGSPGMEVPSGEVQPYDVLLVHPDGTTSVYAHYKK